MEREQEDQCDCTNRDQVDLNAVSSNRILHVIDVCSLPRQMIALRIIGTRQFPQLLNECEGLFTFRRHPRHHDHTGVFVRIEHLERLLGHILLRDWPSHIFDKREYGRNLRKCFERIVQLLLVCRIAFWQEQRIGCGLPE